LSCIFRHESFLTITEEVALKKFTRQRAHAMRPEFDGRLPRPPHGASSPQIGTIAFKEIVKSKQKKSQRNPVGKLGIIAHRSFNKSPQAIRFPSISMYLRRDMALVREKIDKLRARREHRKKIEKLLVRREDRH
jgi:hypothetical protein